MRTVNFGVAFVKSGTKATNESAPQVTIASTYNTFKLNNLAMKSLGLAAGDTVVMFDNFDPNDITTQDDRYLIAKGNFDVDDLAQGAKLSPYKSFNYSHIYNTILLGEAGVESVSTVEMINKGIIVDTGSSKVSTKVGTAELVPYQDEEVEIAEGVMRKVYRLVNFKFRAHDIELEGDEVPQDEVPEANDGGDDTQSED